IRGFHVTGVQTCALPISECRTGLLGAILHKEYRAASEVHSGDLMSRLTSDVSRVSQGLCVLLPNIAGMLTKITGAMVILYILDWRLSIGLAIVVGLLLLAARLFKNQMKHLNGRAQEAEAAAHAFTRGVLENLLVIKAFNAEQRWTAQASDLQEEHRHAKV